MVDSLSTPLPPAKFPGELSDVCFDADGVNVGVWGFTTDSDDFEKDDDDEDDIVDEIEFAELDCGVTKLYP